MQSWNPKWEEAWKQLTQSAKVGISNGKQFEKHTENLDEKRMQTLEAQTENVKASSSETSSLVKHAADILLSPHPHDDEMCNFISQQSFSVFQYFLASAKRL